MLMSSYANDKRIGRRMNQEIVVGVKTNKGVNVAYTIDVSRGGVKVASPVLMLPVGERVELIIEKRGEKYPFPGRVAREDRNYYITRISRSANAFFIKIDDARFLDFVSDNYFL